MRLLSTLLPRPWKRIAPTVVERRGAERIETSVPVSIRGDGMLPCAGTVINISMTGAAISLHGWNVPVPAPWPTRLHHGDEIALVALLGVPLACWVVAVDEGLLRVRFLFDDVARRQLRELIERLAAG